MFRLAVLTIALLGLTACGGDTPADPVLVPSDSVTLNAVRDNTIFEEGTSALSNGAGQHIFAGNPAQPGRRRGLIRFDLTGAGIPTGATLDSVTLTLHMNRTSAGLRTVSLHRVSADWGEGTSVGPMGEGIGAPATTGDATWLHRFFDTTRWTNLGGDFVASPSASTSVGAEGNYRWGSPSLATDVSAWLANPASNFGWILIGDETALATAKRFDSRESSEAASRPKLRVYFRRPR